MKPRKPLSRNILDPLAEHWQLGLSEAVRQQAYDYEQGLPGAASLVQTSEVAGETMSAIRKWACFLC